MSTFSAVINGQLVALAPANAVAPPPAQFPVIGQGAAPNNLPSMGYLGGATNAGVNAVSGVTPLAYAVPPASTGVNGTVNSPANSPQTLAGLGGNVWSLPVWENPLFLVLFFLALGYVILRYIHWRA